MATNQYGQNYAGNDDFRGWLAGNGYSSLLSFTGNDGNVDPTVRIQTNVNGQTSTQGAMDYANKVNELYNQWLSERNDNSVNQTNTYDEDAAAAAREESIRQNAIKGYNDTITRTNNAINDLAGSLQNKLDEIEGNYKTYQNEQQSSYDQAKNDYDNSSRQNMNSLVSNRNTIINNASAGLRGLMRVLGAHGAGGSSVAMYEAPGAVKRQADQENANASQTYAQNQANLDTDWGNYQIGYENDKKKLEDWRTGQIKSAKQENEQKRIDLLNQLSQAYTNRAQYGGALDGDYNTITDRINASNQTIKDLGKYTTPQYTGTTAVYESQPLSSYDTGKMNLTTSVNNSSGSTPALLTVLQGLNNKKKNTVGA